MPAKRKKAKPANEPTPPAVFQSVAASEHATEGETIRKVIELPGMVGEGVEKPVYPELDAAVFDYVAARDSRMLHGLEEKTQKTLILAIMDAKKLGSYEVNDLVVVRKPKDETSSLKVVSKADYVGEPKGGDDSDDD
jgi:hypothetical protein